MLKMMNSVERISQLIPIFKQQLIFLEEREKLFRKNSDDSFQNTSTISKSLVGIPTNSQALPVVSIDSKLSSPIHLRKTNLSSTISIDNSPRDDFTDDTNIHLSFPDVYTVPSLPNSLTRSIEAGILDHFRPHFHGRQILIDAVVHDLITNFNLLYPTKSQYNIIGSGIVKCLKLPLTPENISIWKDALQTKLKRTRIEHPNNFLVQQFRSKYSQLGSGRPVKKKIDELAERDRHKQMVIIPYDQIPNDLQSKVEQLKDLSQIDINTQLILWKDTFRLRRQIVRDHTTSDILNNFPAYSSSFFVFEEVKILTNVDLSSEVRKQIPILIDKVVETPSFITDSSSIRLIKVLCRQFDETIQHILCDQEPSTPYPTLVCIDDVICIYVDFIKILSTNSPDDALALLIAMYTIFELSFDKKSRTVRLLYAVLHGDRQFLSNSIRTFISEKKIDIRRERLKQSLISSDYVLNGSTTFTNQYDAPSLSNIRSSDGSSTGNTYSINSQAIECTASIDNLISNQNITVDTNEFNNNRDKSSLPIFTTKKSFKKKRKHVCIEDQENDTFDNSILENNDNRQSTNYSPLDDVTNSTLKSRRTKRKR